MESRAPGLEKGERERDAGTFSRLFVSLIEGRWAAAWPGDNKMTSNHFGEDVHRNSTNSNHFNDLQT